MNGEIKYTYVMNEDENKTMIRGDATDRFQWMYVYVKKISMYNQVGSKGP